MGGIGHGAGAGAESDVRYLKLNVCMEALVRLLTSRNITTGKCIKLILNNFVGNMT